MRQVEREATAMEKWEVGRGKRRSIPKRDLFTANWVERQVLMVHIVFVALAITLSSFCKFWPFCLS